MQFVQWQIKIRNIGSRVQCRVRDVGGRRRIQENSEATGVAFIKLSFASYTFFSLEMYTATPLPSPRQDP